MTFTGAHKDIPIGDIHIAYNWEYADATARLAATGFTADDVGKEARQLSDNSIWMMTDDSPITWVQTGGAATPLATVAESGTGTNNTKAVTPAGLFGAAVDVASGATTNIGAAASLLVRITGTTTITAFDTIVAGIRRIGYFAGALTLTHNATSLILPGGANITTAAGDGFEAISLGSGNWKVVFYQRADGTPISGGSGVAEDLTTAETDTSKVLAPDGVGGVEWVAPGGGGAPTEIDPTTITGCVLWYDADQQTGAEDDAIGTLDDWSASNNDATQGTAGDKPLLRLNAANGRRGWQFDGVSDHLDLGTNLDIATTHTIICVVAPFAITSAYSCVLKYKQQGIFAPIATANINWGLYRGGQINCGTVSPAPQLIGVWGSSNSDWYILNGKMRKKGTTTTAFDAGSASAVGADPSNVQFFSGFIFEIIAFNTKIASADLLALTKWLHYKWGIPDFA